jgi:hypothetical protein
VSALLADAEGGGSGPRRESADVQPSPPDHDWEPNVQRPPADRTSAVKRTAGSGAPPRTSTTHLAEPSLRTSRADRTPRASCRPDTVTRRGSPAGALARLDGT